MKNVRRATAKDRSAINKLRLRAYRSSVGFKLLGELCVTWNGSMAESIVVAALDGKECLARRILSYLLTRMTICQEDSLGF